MAWDILNPRRRFTFSAQRKSSTQPQSRSKQTIQRLKNPLPFKVLSIHFRSVHTGLGLKIVENSFALKISEI
uniref:C2 domain-containing protein n=1 Tax=Mesocestoides corti TaxID=53468 RepID=A0A5K3EM41_MESCO